MGLTYIFLKTKIGIGYILLSIFIMIVLFFINISIMAYVNKVAGALFIMFVVLPFIVYLFSFRMLYDLKLISEKKDHPLQSNSISEAKESEPDISIDIKEYKDHSVLNHILLYGGAGQGKTALAKVLKNELERVYEHPIEFIKVSPSQLTSKKQLDEVMLKVASNKYCVLFIDEIHGMNRVIEESLYPALQDGEYDITLSEDINVGDDVRFVLQKDKGVQTIQLPKFTCIGATTLIGEINKPLRDRFPIVIEMEEYTKDQLMNALNAIDLDDEPEYFDEYVGQENAKKILQYHLKALKNKYNIKLSEDALQLISDISFNTMRVAKQYKKNSIVIAKAKNKKEVKEEDVKEMMRLYGINEDGLARPHLAIIKALLERYNSTPSGKSYSLGSKALANMAGVTKSDIDEIYIPVLMKAGIVQLDSRSMKQLTQMAINKYGYLLNERIE